MNFIMPLFTVIAFFWVIFSYVNYSSNMDHAANVMQQTAAAGMGAVSIILPYLLCRLFQGQMNLDNQKSIIKLLENLQSNDEN
jgi:hypothetical protein